MNKNALCFLCFLRVIYVIWPKNTQGCLISLCIILRRASCAGRGGRAMMPGRSEEGRGRGTANRSCRP